MITLATIITTATSFLLKLLITIVLYFIGKTIERDTIIEGFLCGWFSGIIAIILFRVVDLVFPLSLI